MLLTFPAMRRTRLYRSGGEPPLRAGLLLVATIWTSCATAPAPVAEPALSGWEDPEGAIEALTGAWNDRDVERMSQAFLPSRRTAVRAHLEEDPRQLATFEVVDAEVLVQCHPRGAYWKTGVLRLRPRLAAPGESAVVEEIVWMRLQDDHWFMYSL